MQVHLLPKRSHNCQNTHTLQNPQLAMLSNQHLGPAPLLPGVCRFGEHLMPYKENEFMPLQCD